MNYRIVNLRDLPYKILSFAEERNKVLDSLEDQEYVLWKSEDEELTSMLLQYIERLPPQQPYYAIRRINLYDGKYKEAANPDYSPHLVSNRVRYSGAVHEQVQPRNPHGRIDFPIIHNHVGMWKYRSGWKQTRAYLPFLALKRGYQVARNG